MIKVLFRLSLVFFFADTLSALDEGRFLWVPKNNDNFTSNVKNSVSPARWTRSIFNWLHSPLMNSIQEAFVIDSIYEKLPENKCKKRSVTAKPDDSKIEENFVNKFFLWMDNDGTPLEFGLKQVGDLRLTQKHLGPGRIVSRSLWEEPMFYEDNLDVNEIDMDHLSFHEQLKLNDMRQKMNSALKHIFKPGKTTKTHSKYYSLPPHSTTFTPLTSKKISTKNYVSKKDTYDMKLVTEPKYYSERIEDSTSGITITDTDIFINNESKRKHFNSNDLNLPIVSKIRLESDKNLYNEQNNDLNNIRSDLTSERSSCSGDIFLHSDTMSLKSSSKDAELTNLFWNDVKNKRDPKETSNAETAPEYFPIYAKNYKSSRTVRNSKFSKHGRKGNRKRKKCKYGGQYELFRSNLKLSQ